MLIKVLTEWLTSVTNAFVKTFSRSNSDILTMSIIQLELSKIRSWSATGDRMINLQNLFQTSLSNFWKAILLEVWHVKVNTKKTRSLRLSRPRRKTCERSPDRKPSSVGARISSKVTWKFSKLEKGFDFRKIFLNLANFELCLKQVLRSESRLFGGMKWPTLEQYFLWNFLENISDFIIKSSAYAATSSKPSGNRTRTTELPLETRNAFWPGWVERDMLWFWIRSGKNFWSPSFKTGIGGLHRNEMNTFEPANGIK